MWALRKAVAALLAIATPLSQAIELDITDSASIKNAASTVAHGLMKYYTGNITNTPETLGILPQPYYWWEAGAVWGGLLDYFHFTGDSTYNEVTTQALLSQVGPLYDYMVPQQVQDEGNDDQAFWGFATMSAAEKNYPPPTIGGYSWVELTENLWNTQVRRWDTTSCNGGLRWQIFPFNRGYDYKNSVSNGAFFQLSARLARFTKNQTYADWAEKSLQWSQDIGFISSDWHVVDGATATTDCTDQDKIIWTYNAGIFLYGSAIMYNYTDGSSIWETRTQGFLDSTSNFFSPSANATNVMFEPACEPIDTCNNDQYSFKAYLSRFMWASTLMAPFTTNAVTTRLQTSSMAAAQACSGGTDGVTCGQHWYYGGYDGLYGVGQQLSALETIQGLLIQDTLPPVQSVAGSTNSAPSAAPVPSSTPSSSSSTSPSQSTSTSSSSEASTQTSSVLSSSTQSSLPSTIQHSSSSSSTSISSSSLASSTTTVATTDVALSNTLSSTTSASSTTPTANPTATPKTGAGRRSDLPTWLAIISAGVVLIELTL